eukprot:Colp12_sorted_trinity150504_noHs@9777
MSTSLYSVIAILVLDNDGNRILCKYYDASYPTVKEQRAFEKNLFQKTQRANAEIIMFDGVTCVYKSNVDLFFYVVGSADENELLLATVLNAFYDALALLLRNQVEKRVVIDNLDGVLLALDEVVDEGVILEADAHLIASRVVLRGDNDIPLSEQTISQALQTAKEQLARSILK